MKFSDILYILRNAVCAPAPPPSPAIKPIALADLEAELLTTARLALQADAPSSRAPAFGGPPLASKKRSFEEVFGEDSDEESEDE